MILIQMVSNPIIASLGVTTTAPGGVTGSKSERTQGLLRARVFWFFQQTRSKLRELREVGHCSSDVMMSLFNRPTPVSPVGVHLRVSDLRLALMRPQRVETGGHN